jgi:Fanconi anemia group J protein
LLNSCLFSTLLAQSGSCRFRNHTDDLVGDPRLRRGGSKEIWDIEDLNALGLQVGGKCAMGGMRNLIDPYLGCPYFASRDMAATAELIVCPYNYLVDPSKFGDG